MFTVTCYAICMIIAWRRVLFIIVSISIIFAVTFGIKATHHQRLAITAISTPDGTNSLSVRPADTSLTIGTQVADTPSATPTPVTPTVTQTSLPPKRTPMPISYLQNILTTPITFLGIGLSTYYPYSSRYV